MQFLIVDDSPTMGGLFLKALKTFGYENVVDAEDGQDALAKLYTDPVDFIITDWNMPNMNGLQLTEAIRSEASTSKLPILMVTTRGLKQDIVEALQAKVNNYVLKPFTPYVLKEKIDAVLQSMS